MRTFALVITALAIAALSGCHTGPAAASQEQIMKLDGEVSTVLNDFHNAAARSDYSRYFARWSEQSVFLGTDATERWVGQQFMNFARPYFDRGRGWSYRPRDRHISFSPDGRTAWFDELLDSDQYGECRGSGVLLSVNDGWIIVQYNLSYPVPNELADEVTKRIRERKRPHQE